jgi:hypothetical protein
LGRHGDKITEGNEANEAIQVGQQVPPIHGRHVATSVSEWMPDRRSTRSRSWLQCVPVWNWRRWLGWLSAWKKEAVLGVLGYFPWEISVACGSACGEIALSSAIAIIGRKRMNSRNSTENTPKVPKNVKISTIDGL